MSRKPSKSPANGTPEAADLSAADPKDGNADTSVAVATQDPQAAEDVNARECEFCAMVMPADSKDPACPMCFRDNRLYIMLRFLAAKGQTYCNAVHDGKRCEYVLNMRSDGKDVFCPMDKADRAIFAAERKLREEAPTTEAQAKLAEAKGFFNGGDDWKALKAANQVFDLQAKPFVEEGLSNLVEAELGPLARAAYDEAVSFVEHGQYVRASECVVSMKNIMPRERMLIAHGERLSKTDQQRRQRTHSPDVEDNLGRIKGFQQRVASHAHAGNDEDGEN